MRKLSKKNNSFELLNLPLFIHGLFLIIWIIVSLILVVSKGPIFIYIGLAGLVFLTLFLLSNYYLKKSLQWIVDEVFEENGKLHVRKGEIKHVLSIETIESVNIIRGNPNLVTVKTNQDFSFGNKLQFIPEKELWKTIAKTTDSQQLIANLFKC